MVQIFVRKCIGDCQAVIGCNVQGIISDCENCKLKECFIQANNYPFAITSALCEKCHTLIREAKK